MKIPTPNILKSHACGSTRIDIIGEIKKLKDEFIELVGGKAYFLVRKLILSLESSDRGKDPVAFCISVFGEGYHYPQPDVQLLSPLLSMFILNGASHTAGSSLSQEPCLIFIVPVLLSTILSTLKTHNTYY